MTTNKVLLALLVASISIATVNNASATAVAVSPLRLELKAGQTATGLYLTNANDTAGPYQIMVMKWTQVDGKDVYTPSQSVVASPAITTVQPHSRQIVRILETRPVAPGSAYRVYVKQLPPPATEKHKGLQYLLTISLPLFVAAPADGVAKLDWQQSAGCHWKISNSGNVVARITDVSVNGQPIAAGLLGYVLPGSYLDLQPGNCHTTGNISAEVNGQPFTAGR